MELRDYLAIVRKRWTIIALVTVVAVGLAALATALATPVYDARAQVYVSISNAGSTNDLLQGSSYTQRQVKSYTALITTPRVLQPVIDDLGLEMTPEDLAGTVSADFPPDTSLINIHARHPEPQMAAEIANELAQSLAGVVDELERPDEGISPVAISTVREASAPTAPASPQPARNMVLGLLLGLAAGFALAVLRQVLDTRVRTADDIRALTDASVMTVVPEDSGSTSRLPVRDEPASIVAEAFRRLRTNLQFLDTAEPLEAIVVTSSIPGEGKSTVAANLAITLADAGSRVVLVDADLRRPSVAEYLGIEGSVGLTTVLIGQASLEDVVQPWGGGNLQVLPSGQVPPNPSEMIGSRAMAWVLAELRRRYDVVIIDTPPLLPVTDAAILARIANGALLVAGTHNAHRNQVLESLGSLEAVGARVLGLIVNRVQRQQSEAYAYYGADETQPPVRRRRAVGRAASPTGRRTPPIAAARLSPTVAHRPAAAAPSPAAPPGARGHEVPPAARPAPTESPRRVSVTARQDGTPAAPHDATSFDALLHGALDEQPARRTWPGGRID